MTSIIKCPPKHHGHAAEPITSYRLAKPVGPFSPAVRDANRVCTGGQVAQGPTTGKLVDGGVVAQTEQIFATSKRS